MPELVGYPIFGSQLAFDSMRVFSYMKRHFVPTKLWDGTPWIDDGRGGRRAIAFAPPQAIGGCPIDRGACSPSNKFRPSNLGVAALRCSINQEFQ